MSVVSARCHEGRDLDLDGLYDLACHLMCDQSEAEKLVLWTLHGRELSSLEGGGIVEDLRAHLVHAYLRRNGAFPGRRFWLPRILNGRKDGASPEELGLESGLSKLIPEERVCLILRERLGLPVAEIAHVTGLGRGRTHLVLFSARERLLTLTHK